MTKWTTVEHTNDHDGEIKTLLDCLSVQLLRQVRESNAWCIGLTATAETIISSISLLHCFHNSVVFFAQAHKF